MDREHFFRGKRLHDNVWLFLDLEEEVVSEGQPCTFLQYHIIPETIGQYTTLKDSANTKIFEGDIFPVMRVPARGLAAAVNSFTAIFGEVVFHKAMFCIRFKHPEVADPYTYVPLHEFLAGGNKIIAGNIHDNANLINE